MANYKFTAEKYKKELSNIIKDLLNFEKVGEHDLMKVIRRYPKDQKNVFRKDHIIAGIDWFMENDLDGLFVQGGEDEKKKLLLLRSKLLKKPVRSISGVTTVTVLTKPYPCPGQCIFCPNDLLMPKSYISNEPGAQRAVMNKFSPYLQVYNRLKAYQANGHPIDKIELLVLGGTWTSYPENYKRWFIKECFRAMNEFGTDKTTLTDIVGLERVKKLRETIAPLNELVMQNSYNRTVVSKEYRNLMGIYISPETKTTWDELKIEQDKNSTTKSRCVGLVLETRSDMITPQEALNMRKLGATKVQLGVQTLDDQISKLNKRGETKEDVKMAFEILRTLGFKIHAHIMPNLYGATLKSDLNTYKELFEDPNYKPDEIKIYPASVIKHTRFYKHFADGEHVPYSNEELVNLIKKCMEITPEYCRITRVIRDIPSTEIEGGNKITNLRQIVEQKLKKENRLNPNIRAREIRNRKIQEEGLNLNILKYQTKISSEYFLQYITKEREIAGFLRLSIPIGAENITPELLNCAIIREVHVYGPSLEIEKPSTGHAQHTGLGTKLIIKAKHIAWKEGYKKLAVISAVGTREYYEKRGFKLKNLYQIAELE